MLLNRQLWQRARSAINHLAEQISTNPASPTTHQALNLEQLEARVLLSGDPLAPGDLNPTFGDGGMVAIDFPTPQADSGRDVVALQDDDKIIVAGTSWSPEGGDVFALTRYNPDGSLDASFGDGGKVSSILGSGTATAENATGVALDSSGRIVVVGNQGQDIAVARYTSDGNLDADFGGCGYVITNISPNNHYDCAKSVVIDEYNKIVVAGYSSIQRGDKWQYDFSLARFNSDGSLDTNFGMDLDGDGTRDGKVVTDFGLTYDGAQSVTIDSHNRIVLAGWSQQPIEGTPYIAYDFAIARYNPDGTPDTIFGEDGQVTTDFGLGLKTNYYAYDVAVDIADKIIAVGYVQNGPRDFVLARYNDDGSLDASFDGDGLLTTDVGGGDDRAYSVIVDGEDRIIAVGSSWDASGDCNFALIRLNGDGSLDMTFDSDGKVFTDFDTPGDIAYGVAIDGSGRIVAAGRSVSSDAYLTIDESSDFALARYNIDGSLDTSFDGDGKVTTDFIAPNTDVAYDVVASQSDGKIVVAGYSSASGRHTVFALARLNTDGSLDATFGTEGKVMMPMGYACGVVIDANDKIIVAGTTPASDFALVCYNSDGTLDTTFDGDGIVVTDFGSYGSKRTDNAQTLAIGPDGKIVVAGYSNQPTPNRQDFALARYNSDGTLDTTFGGDGTITTDFGFPANEDIRSVAVQADGKIVVAGRVGWPEEEFTVVRYNIDGSLDTTFDDDGIIIMDFGVNKPSLANGVVIDADGKIVVAGYSSSVLALARYNIDGSLDTTFDNDGMVTKTGLKAMDVVIDTQDRIVVAGAPWPGFKVGRFNSDGSADLSFGTNGIASSNFGGYYEVARGVDIDSDGNIIVAGYSWLPDTGRGYDFMVTRFIGQTNQPPVAAGDNYVTDEDNTLIVSVVEGVLANDSDPDDDPLTAILLDGPSDGTLTFNSDGSFTYTPIADCSGTDSFTYTANDSSEDSDPATVNIQVNNLPDLAGRVYDDLDNSGVDDGEPGIGGVAVRLTGIDDKGAAVDRLLATDLDGSFLFDDLRPGTYNLTESQPTMYLDGDEMAGSAGGIIGDDQIFDIMIGTDDPDTSGYRFGEIKPSHIQGLVWEDFNNDGEVNFNEKAIGDNDPNVGVTILIAGTDDRGNSVNRSTTTDEDGSFMFIDLRPSDTNGYTLQEIQPIEYDDGLDSLGKVNDVQVGDDSVNDIFSGIVLSQPDSVGENYNFGERPTAEDPISDNQTAVGGFWHNKNGRNLIKSLNGGETST